MFRLFRLLFLITLFAVGVGCTVRVRPDPLKPFPNRANRFDVVFAWETHPTPGALEVSGVAKNVRYAYINGLRLQLSLLDRDDKVLAQDTYFFIPEQMAMDDTSPFHLTLKATPPPGARLRFNYRYRSNDGDTMFYWTSIFTADAATGAVFPQE